MSAILYPARIPRETIIIIVSEVLNALEHEYDIEGVENLGPPTTEEIADRIIEKYGGAPQAA